MVFLLRHRMVYPDCIYHNHDHCQPERTKCSGGCRNRGKNNQFPFPGTIFYVIHGLSARSTEYGRGGNTIGRSDPSLCMGIAVGFGVCVAVLIQFIAEPVVGLFTTDTMVVILGAQYIRGYIWDCIFAGYAF